jgi:hypothetical protein
MKTLLVAIVSASLMTHLFGLQDTPENRAELADRLIRTFPIQDWWYPPKERCKMCRMTSATLSYQYSGI